MKIKNAPGYSGYKIETKKVSQNSYRKKLDSLVPGNVLLPDNASSEVFKLRSIKPPIKNLRMPMKIQHAIHHLPYLHHPSHQQENNFINTQSGDLKPRQNKKMHNLSEHSKKNVELLDHMIDILRNKESSKPHHAPIRINTQPGNFNEFMHSETASSKNNRGPILDPKISKFYDNNRRQIFSEQKSRNGAHRQIHMERHSVAKGKNLDNLQLITFYNNRKQTKEKQILSTEESHNQFM